MCCQQVGYALPADRERPARKEEHNSDSLREHRERIHVSRLHDAEVASVDGRDVGDVAALGGGDHRRVDGAEREVAIVGDEFGDSQPVSGGHGLDRECAGSEVAEEADFGLDAESGREQVGHLGDDEDRDDQRADVRFEKLERCRVMRIVRIDVGVQGARVDEQRRYRATSAARISSMRSDTSVLPL